MMSATEVAGPKAVAFKSQMRCGLLLELHRVRRNQARIQKDSRRPCGRSRLVGSDGTGEVRTEVYKTSANYFGIQMQARGGR